MVQAFCQAFASHMFHALSETEIVIIVIKVMIVIIVIIVIIAIIVIIIVIIISSRTPLVSFSSDATRGFRVLEPYETPPALVFGRRDCRRNTHHNCACTRNFT